MKRFFFILSFLTNLLMSFNSAHSQWVQIADFPVTGLYEVCFINPDIGFVSGVENSNYVLYKSIDGGITWMPVGANIIGMIQDMCFVDDQVGFILTDDNWEGYIYKTSDQGDSWEQVFTFGMSAKAISFPDENTGYAVFSATDNAWIFKTVDNGDTWDQINYLTTEIGGAGVTDMQFISSELGYLVFEWGIAYKSVDGGSNFVETYQDYDYNLYSMHFINTDTGFMVGEYKQSFLIDSCGFIAKTTNGGNDWIKSSLPGHFKDVTFINSDTGYIAAEDYIYESFDGGNSWQISELDSNLYLLIAVDFPDQTTGYALSNWFTMSRLYKLDLYADIKDPAGFNNIYRLYPNPVSDYCNLTIPDELGTVAFTLIDLSGATVYGDIFDTPAVRRINLDSFSPGMYLGILKSRSGMNVFKMVIK